MIYNGIEENTPEYAADESNAEDYISNNGWWIMRYDTHRIFEDHMVAENLLKEAITPEDKALCEAWRDQLSKEYSVAWRYWYGY